jgi:hypothetical protein
MAEPEVEVTPDPGPFGDEGDIGVEGAGRSSEHPHGHAAGDVYWKRGQNAVRLERLRAQAEGQIRATLERGGDPSHGFISVGANERTDMIGNERVTYVPQWFHILDAIEFEIGQARTAADLLRIYRFYVKDPLQGPEPLLAPFFNADELPARDPHGRLRMEVFLSSATKREASLLRQIREELKAGERDALKSLVKKARETKGPCQAIHVPRRGGDDIHNRFADLVTGRTTDFLLAAPGPIATYTDGLDSRDPNLVWEVKTRHQFLAEWALPGNIFAPRVQDAIMDIEAQRQRHMVVSARCGFRLAYAFDVLEVAEFFRRTWGNNPPVYHRQGPG